jgi:3-hydroxyisobutyrate dehydrogenase-like beta-hydroxyacid dehydrogenase
MPPSNQAQVHEAHSEYVDIPGTLLLMSRVAMLSDDAALESVALGDGGIIGSLAKGAIHVSMSTISVALSKRLAQAHAKAGQGFVAAPVFGRPDAAAAAKLFIVVAGEP